MKNELNLNPRQEAFCREYIIDHNGTQAAMRAGYKATTADVQASRLLTIDKVKTRVAELETEAIANKALTVDKVIDELCCIAFFNVKNVFAENGKLVNVHDMTDEDARAIASIETHELKNKKGVVVGHARRVKTNDKIRALELLGKFKQMFIDRIEERKTVEERKIIKLSGSMPDDE